MILYLWPALLSLLLLSGCIQHEKSEESRDETTRFLYYTVNSYKQTIQILDNIGYTDEVFKKRVTKIPRVLITRISRRWGEQALNIPVEVKKSVFFRLMASGALIANEEIMNERRKLLKLSDKLRRGVISHKERVWLQHLAKKYRVVKKRADRLTPDKLKKLIRRVDIVPVSIILAQGAIESGWGTSRFAIEGNALFGQWSFSDKSLKPKGQRSHLGDYGLATFKTPLDSIRSYLLNLNTHPAYKEFRQLRSKMRTRNTPLSGKELLHTLKHYSERKKEYIEDLKRIIRTNRLFWIDRAELMENRTVIIHPEA